MNDQITGRSTYGVKKTNNGAVIGLGVAVGVLFLLCIVFIIMWAVKGASSVNVTDNVYGYNSRLPVPISPSARPTPPPLGGAGIGGTQPVIRAGLPSVQGVLKSRVGDGVSFIPGNDGMASVQAATNNARHMQNVAQHQAALASYQPQVSIQHTMSSQLPAGATDVEKAVAAAQGLSQSYPDQTGKMPQLIYDHEGPSMAHAAPTKVKAQSLDTAFHDGYMEQFDPEGYAKLSKAMSQSGMPAVMGMDDATATDRKKSEIMKSLMLNGAIDPSVEDILGASSPFIATNQMLRRASSSKAAMDRDLILPPPMRFLYQSPLYRPAVPAPTMSPFVGDNGPMTPGQEFYISTISCDSVNGPNVAPNQEPY
jgi:hypothetical protein